VANLLTRISEAYLALRGEKRSGGVSSGNFTSWDEFAYMSHGRPYSPDGLSVIGEDAMYFSPVAASINLISHTIASMPAYVYKYDKEESYKDAPEHAMYKLLLSEPNELMTWYDFWVDMIKAWHIYDRGAYAWIERDGLNRPVSITPLNEGECDTYYENMPEGKRLQYVVWGKLQSPNNILHLSHGLKGVSPLSYACNAVGLGISSQEFGQYLYKNGLNLQGIIEHPGDMGKEQMVKLKDQMKEYKGSKKAHGTLILERGAKYNPISANPSTAQFIETRKFQAEEVARFLGVPMHMIGILDKATNNNIEQQSKEFFTYTILPKLKKIQASMDMRLNQKWQKGQYYHEFDTKDLILSDVKSMSELIKTNFHTGAWSSNDIRQLSKKPLKKGLDRHFVQSQYAEITENGIMPINSKDNGSNGGTQL
jgi:HK97 family phage portal protein